MTAAALTAAMLLGVGVLFQAALAAGARWRHISYGGRAGTTPGALRSPYRLMSAASVVILGVAAWVILAAADLAPQGPLGQRFLSRAVWVVFVFLVLNTAANVAAKHAVERYGFAAVTAIAAFATLVVALSI